MLVSETSFLYPKLISSNLFTFFWLLSLIIKIRWNQFDNQKARPNSYLMQQRPAIALANIFSFCPWLNFFLTQPALWPAMGEASPCRSQISTHVSEKSKILCYYLVHFLRLYKKRDRLWRTTETSLSLFLLYFAVNTNIYIHLCTTIFYYPSTHLTWT